MTSTLATKRLLIIDDEAHVREVVQTCLEALGGWNILTAASGQEGLEKAATNQPDAIILDIMMPGMSGLDFLRYLNANSALQSIPVVLLTARADLIESDKSLPFNTAGAIAKPFDPRTLHLQIATLLGWV